MFMNSRSNSLTLDLMRSISTFKYRFCWIRETHPSLRTIVSTVSFAVLVGALSPSKPLRQLEIVVRSCNCSKKRTWRTNLRGNRSFCDAWLHASMESFPQFITLQRFSLSFCESQGCACEIRNYIRIFIMETNVFKFSKDVI